MAYFRNHGTVYYRIQDGETIIINDLTVFVGVKDRYLKDPNFHITYDWKDGDRFDKLAYRLYDDVNLWWTIPLVNGMFNFDADLPLREDQLDEYIEKKYMFKSQHAIHHYGTTDGYWIDLYAVQDKYNLNNLEDAVAQLALTPVTILQYETQLNNDRRKVLVVDPRYINRFVQDTAELYKQLA